MAKPDLIQDEMNDKRFPAAVRLIGHTGAQEFQIRFCDEEKPVIWMAIARYGQQLAIGASITPLTAVFKLCDDLIDGGQCTHCHRPTGFEPGLSSMPLDELVCWCQWDPSHEEFRRGCKDTHK